MVFRGLCLWLSVALILMPGQVVAETSSRVASGNITVDDAHKRAIKGEIVLVDIRAPDEWRQSGVPASGRLITMYQAPASFIGALKASIRGNAAKPIALICATGGRSLDLQKVLREAGFKNILNVVGGMFGTKQHRRWHKAGLPVRRWSP